MSCALSGLNGVQCYLTLMTLSYPVAISRTMMQISMHALKRLTELGVTLNYDKCHFNMPTLHFLGHAVSSEGLTPDPTHVEALT